MFKYFLAIIVAVVSFWAAATYAADTPVHRREVISITPQQQTALRKLVKDIFGSYLNLNSIAYIHCAEINGAALSCVLSEQDNCTVDQFNSAKRSVRTIKAIDKIGALVRYQRMHDRVTLTPTQVALFSDYLSKAHPLIGELQFLQELLVRQRNNEFESIAIYLAVEDDTTLADKMLRKEILDALPDNTE